jgi:hypothetical protein
MGEADADAGEIEPALREVKRAGEQMAAVKTERARVEAEIAQAAITPAQVGDAMTLAAQLRDYIPEADYDAKRYILERLGIRCRLRRTEAGDVLADVTANLPGQVVSTALQIFPQARPGQCCDSRPAPRTPGGRSG